VLWKPAVTRLLQTSTAIAGLVDLTITIIVKTVARVANGSITAFGWWRTTFTACIGLPLVDQTVAIIIYGITDFTVG